MRAFLVPRRKVTNPKIIIKCTFAMLLAIGIPIASAQSAFAAPNSNLTFTAFCDGGYTCGGSAAQCTAASSTSLTCTSARNYFAMTFDDGPTVSTARTAEYFSAANDSMSSFMIGGTVRVPGTLTSPNATVHMQLFRDNYQRVLLTEQQVALPSSSSLWRAPYSDNDPAWHAVINAGFNYATLPYNDTASSLKIWISRP